jgi:hypothetical protein
MVTKPTEAGEVVLGVENFHQCVIWSVIDLSSYEAIATNCKIIADGADAIADVIAVVAASPALWKSLSLIV